MDYKIRTILEGEDSLLHILKVRGYKQASLAVQKANYAVKMYLKTGFEIADENASRKKNIPVQNVAALFQFMTGNAASVKKRWMMKRLVYRI